MTYSLEVIKEDIQNLEARKFYLKHIVRSENWYVEKILQKSGNSISATVDDFRSIVSETMGISFNSVMMVGSGKVGYSLAPKSDKLFAPFNEDENIRSISDVDVAIISSELFYKYWQLFRRSFKLKYKVIYEHVFNEIYRGYINERNLLDVGGCRVEWSEAAISSKKTLREELFIRHDISFRIYRSWEDFEEYNVQAIDKIKREMA